MAGPLSATFYVSTAHFYFPFRVLLARGPLWRALPSASRSIDGLFPRLLLEPALWFLSSSCFCTLSLSSEVGGSEQLERTWERGPVNRPPLERWTSRSWKPPDPGSFCTGSENRCGCGRSPSGQRGRYPLCRFSRVSKQGLVSKSESQRCPGNLKQMQIL